jgi:hypothetical protein
MDKPLHIWFSWKLIQMIRPKPMRRNTFFGHQQKSPLRKSLPKELLIIKPAPRALKRLGPLPGRNYSAAPAVNIN